MLGQKERRIMAEKRMFSNKITQSDPFLAMPASSQNLYFHLNMDADDEGFINRPKSIMRMIGPTKLTFFKSFIEEPKTITIPIKNL